MPKVKLITLKPRNRGPTWSENLLLARRVKEEEVFFFKLLERESEICESDLHWTNFCLYQVVEGY